MYFQVHIKHYPENFVLLILEILGLVNHEICIFLKKQANLKDILLFLMSVKKHFINTGTYNSKSKQSYNAKPFA